MPLNLRAVSVCLSRADAAGVQYVRSLPHWNGLDRVLIGLSRLTDHSDGWLALGLIGAVSDRERWAAWLNGAGYIALAELSSQFIKRMVPRDRPSFPKLPPLAPVPSPRSFPSSHTASAVAALRAFGATTPGWILRLVAAATAFSRLYLGVHYPSDVLAGGCLGAVLAGLVPKCPGKP